VQSVSLPPSTQAANTRACAKSLVESRQCGDRRIGCISKDVCNTSRACGSPAVGAYSTVVPDCLEQSPTAKLYAKLLAAGTQLVGHVDLAAENARDCPRLSEVVREWRRRARASRDYWRRAAVSRTTPRAPSLAPLMPRQLLSSRRGDARD